MLAPEAVVRRFLAKTLQAEDERFRPPREIVNAVDAGELPVEALNVWKAVVEKQTEGARPLDVGAAYAYWRNKCLKNGIALPPGLQKGGEGATHGPWKIKTGDEIEEWVKQTLRSKGLLNEVGKSVHDWQMEITHLERMVAEAQTKIEGRLRGSGPGAKTPLEKSQAELTKYSKELATAKGELIRLQEEAARYEKAKNCAIEFEKEFQFMMLLAAKDLDKASVLESVKKAIARFEQGLEIPDAQSPSHDVDRYRQAGLWDSVSDAAKKAWAWLASTFGALIEWFQDLGADTDKLANLLDQAGALVPGRGLLRDAPLQPGSGLLQQAYFFGGLHVFDEVGGPGDPSGSEEPGMAVLVGREGEESVLAFGDGRDVPFEPVGSAELIHGFQGPVAVAVKQPSQFVRHGGFLW